MTFYLNAPYEIPASRTRFYGYGFSGTPSVSFDGALRHIGGAAAGSMFEAYRPSYLARAATPSPLAMAGSFVIIGDQATVTTTIEADFAPPAGTNQIHFFVAVDNMHLQSYLVVEALPTEPLAITAAGQSQIVERTFTVDPSWPQEDLRIVALVQNHSTTDLEILQATLAVPDYKAAVTIDCVPDGVAAGWTLEGPYGPVLAGNGDKALSTFYAGEFTVTWEEVPYWTPPAENPQTVIVAEGGHAVFTGTFSNGPLAAATAGPLGDPGPSRGTSLVDFDGDGDLDLHVVNEGAADALLRNDGGVFTAAGAGPILDGGLGCSSAWTDFNGDGHVDVYVGRNGETNLLLAGDGAGGFTPVNAFGADDAGQARTVSWLDYDNDGILDIYVVNTGGENRLLKGMGDMGGGFYIFTSQSNGAGDPGNGRGVAWADIDFDGRLDAYVVNANQANLMLQNTAIGFSNIAQSNGTNDLGNGAGAAWGDMDNDGDWDLYVANDGSADRLYEADSPTTFNLVLGENLGDRGRGQGVVFADLDNDTHLDLYVVRLGEPDLMLIGDGTGAFSRAPVGLAEAELAGRSVACGDVDQDGDLDLYVTRDGAANVLFTNVMSNTNHWFAVELEGPAGNPQGIGARVTITSDGVTQMRQITAGSGFLGMSGTPAHFGLGQATGVQELTIHWPDGLVQTAGPLAGDRSVTVVYDQGISGVGDPVPAAANSLAAARPNPFNPATTIDYGLARAGRVRLEIYAVDGRRVRTLVDTEQVAGPHSVVWQGRDDAGRPVASGTYMYRLVTPEGETLSGRMALIK